MRKILLSAVALTAGLAIAGGASASVVTNIYNTFSTSGGGAPFSGFVGSVTTAGVSFATDFGYNWHPFGLAEFGSDTKGTLTAATTGAYMFTLNSDDGSQAFIDGALVVNNGGVHAPNSVTNTVNLTAGAHTFEVQFFECCGGPSGVDFTTPAGITLSSTPEPASWALMILGVAGIGGMVRRQASRKALAVA